VHLFGDEAGDFAFVDNGRASKYFMLTTIAIADCRQLESDLLSLKRELQWDGHDLPGYFHASTDRQAVRDRVYDVLAPHDFRIDVTILEKSKTQPQLANDHFRFYKTLWYYHLKHVAPLVAKSSDDLFLVSASLTTHAKRDQAHLAFKDVASQTARTASHKTAFWDAPTDPCLQAADYCCWAIQRKWERGDDRSYVLVADKIVTEFDMFAASNKHYY